jgi:hypothetical protein
MKARFIIAITITEREYMYETKSVHGVKSKKQGELIAAALNESKYQIRDFGELGREYWKVYKVNEFDGAPYDIAETEKMFIDKAGNLKRRGSLNYFASRTWAARSIVGRKNEI